MKKQVYLHHILFQMGGGGALQKTFEIWKEALGSKIWEKKKVLVF